MYKGAFAKGYESNWSTEVFKIVQVVERNPPVYKICDSELQRINFDPNAPSKIKKVLKKRYKNGKCEVLVQWQNYPVKFDSWIPCESLSTI